MPEAAPRHIPSPENDARWLREWTLRALAGAPVPPLARRYLAALEHMEPDDLVRFLGTLFVINGNNLPTFPDQE